MDRVQGLHRVRGMVPPGAVVLRVAGLLALATAFMALALIAASFVSA